MDKKIPDNVYEKILEYSVISAVDAVIYDDNKVLLAKRLQEPCKGQWWVPGGRQFKGESGEEAIVRKVKQEVGLDVEVEKLIGVRDISFNVSAFPNVDKVSYVARIYLTRLRNSKQKVLLDSTQEKYIWVDKKWFNENKNNLHEYVAKALKDSGVFG